MELLLILIYVSICYVVFKVFRIPVNQWSLATAVLGGIIGAVFLALSIPIARPVMLALGPAEYLMLALWGLTIIATFSDGSLIKGLIAALLGVLAAFIGTDIVTSTPRFTSRNCRAANSPRPSMTCLTPRSCWCGTTAAKTLAVSACSGSRRR